MKKYKSNKRANEISRLYGKQKYKWFQKMNEQYGSRASMDKEISMSVT